MDKDRIDGATKQAKGSVKEAVGKMTGNSKVRLEGTGEENVGKVQSSLGEADGALKERPRR